MTIRLLSRRLRALSIIAAGHFQLYPSAIDLVQWLLVEPAAARHAALEDDALTFAQRRATYHFENLDDYIDAIPETKQSPMPRSKYIIRDSQT